MITNVNFGNNGHHLSKDEERKVDRILRQAAVYQQRQRLKADIKAAISFVLAPQLEYLPAGTKKVRITYRPHFDTIAEKTMKGMNKRRSRK